MMETRKCENCEHFPACYTLHGRKETEYCENWEISMHEFEKLFNSTNPTEILYLKENEINNRINEKFKKP